MKILCLSNYYPPHHEGGYEISVAQAMQAQKELGHQVWVLCGERGVEATRSLGFDASGISRSLHYINYIQASFLDKHRVEKHNYALTLQALRELGPDLVYIGSMKAVSIAPVLAVQKLKVPHVFDLGDIWLKTYLGSGLKSRMFRYLKALLPFTIGGKLLLDPVIVPSLWLKERIMQEYGSREVYVVPRGVSLVSLRPRLFNHPPRWLYAGRIEPKKGLLLIIEALHQVRKTEPDFPFRLDLYGGEDPDYGKLCRDAIAVYKLEESFSFKGHQRDIKEIWNAYDVLLMPTLAEEVFGRVIIEAMATALPVLATDAWGPAEIITDGVDGWLFDPGKPEDLAHKIRQINRLAPAELEQAGQRARAKVESSYEISLVQKQIQIILESIVKKKNKG